MISPLQILIGGLPGTLKSSTAIALARELGVCAVSQTDELREIVRLYDDDPFLADATTTRWQLLGEFSEQSLIEGHRRQSALMEPAVSAILRKSRSRGESCVIEGVHIIPSLYRERWPESLIIFLYDRDAEAIKRRMAKKFQLRPELASAWTAEWIETIAPLQEALLEDAARSGAFTLQTQSADGNADLIVTALRSEGGRPS